MKKIYILFFIFLFNAININAQMCTGCSTLISETDTSDYIVSSGQTLCIDSIGDILGKITLNGGTICNKGFFNPKEILINSGTINNYSNITLNTSLTVSTSINITISAGAIINVNGDFILNNGNIINNGFLNILGTIQNTGGVINNNNVINYNHISGNPVTNSGIINSN